MLHIPPRVLELLADAPPVVVAPVGLGFAQADLEVWARKTKRQVVRDAPGLAPGARALVILGSRGELENLPLGHDLRRFLFLQESDLLFSLDEWQGVMERSGGPTATQSYLETGGWPEGLALARAVADRAGGGPLVRHPLCAARLGSLLPRDIPRETLVRLAQSPLLTREVYDLLGLDEALVAALYDRGLLHAQGPGFALPRLLRLYLRGPTSPETVDALESALRAHGHNEAVLELLAEHGLWERYLWVLVEHRTDLESNVLLQTRLQLVPPSHRHHLTYRYLSTFLFRYAGDTDRMRRELETILPLADNHLSPYVLSAYGVSYGMAGDLEKAVEIFQEALGKTEPGYRLYADILRNTGVAHYLLSNLQDTYKIFIESANLFRTLGLFEPEATVLAALGSTVCRLGHPLEAISYLERAVSTLSRAAAEDCVVSVNLAKSKILMGDIASAEENLYPLPDNRARLRAHIVSKLALANVKLWKGDIQEAQSLAEEVLHSDFKDQQIQDETYVLLGKIAFRVGKCEIGRAHLGRVVRDFWAVTESAWQGLTDLEEAIADMRRREAKFDLAQLLLRKGDLGSLREALELCRTYSYGLLLQHPYFAPHWRPLVLADEAARAAFPIRLQTFGAFGAELLGARIGLADGFKTRKAAMLLAYLALHPRPHSRERLAEIFWGDGSSPLASLNTAVSELRKLFDAPIIEGNKGQLWLGFPAKTDLGEFLSATEPYLRQPVPAEPGALEALLARFEAGWLPDFPDWFAEERAEVENRQAKLWRMLADHHLDAAPQKAIAAYRRVVRLEPYDAEAWASLVKLYEALEEPTLAQQARAAMRTALRELGLGTARPA